MATVTQEFLTMGDLLKHLGDISADRVRLRPSPGQATVQDVDEIERREKCLCELVDGVLVEKIMGYKESLLAVALSVALRAFVRPKNLGVISGEGGMMQIIPGLVRIPDVAFTSWERFPNRTIPNEPVPGIVPDLAVEILSKGNTKQEMSRKRSDYFAAGVRLVWMIDIDDRTVTAYFDPESHNVYTEQSILDGGDVLPGFSLCLAELFAELNSK